MNEEWLNEPDHREFMYKGYNCVINRTESLGHLCGYVDIPENSRFYGVKFLELPDINVHGGITFSDFVNTKGKGHVWRIGFDCAHAWDICPYDSTNAIEFMGMYKQYRNIHFVKTEILAMVDQIIELEKM